MEVSFHGPDGCPSCVRLVLEGILFGKEVVELASCRAKMRSA